MDIEQAKQQIAQDAGVENWNELIKSLESEGLLSQISVLNFNCKAYDLVLSSKDKEIAELKEKIKFNHDLMSNLDTDNYLKIKDQRREIAGLKQEMEINLTRHGEKLTFLNKDNENLKKEIAELEEIIKSQAIIKEADNAGLNSLNKIIKVYKQEIESLKEEIKKYEWIDCKERTPELIDGEDYSENVFAIADGILMIMCYCYIPGDDGGFVWANCNNKIDGDAEFDDEYEVIKWKPIPKI